MTDRDGGSLRLPRHTHDLLIGDTEVVKTYVLHDRGEHHREWAVLNLLHQSDPGLAPKPLRRSAGTGPPQVVMTRVPGSSLEAARLTAAQQDAWADALGRLYRIPVEKVRDAGVGPRLDPEAGLLGLARALAAEAAQRAVDTDSCVRETVSAVCEWIEAPQLPGEAEPVQQVLGMGDGNVANAMWDGQRCRLVDFEDAGLSDIGFEVADHAEHIAVRLSERFDPERFINDLCPRAEDRERCDAYRPLFACWWLLMLLPGNRASNRNPSTALRSQAEHVRHLLREST